MHNLLRPIIRLLRHFEHAFSERVWAWVKVLLIGAILVPGQRTVTAVLRVMGLRGEAHFQNYHRVLNRAAWFSYRLIHILLHLVVQTFVSPDGVVVGLEATIERRRGSKIAATGIYRDPVRSSKQFFVKPRGLRRISMHLLVPIPWAMQIWALPFLTVLAPSERYHQQRRQRHKKLTDWGRQMILQLLCRYPGLRPSATLARHPFFHVVHRTSGGANSTRTA